MNKRIVCSAFLGAAVIAGGAAWRKISPAEAGELQTKVYASRSAGSCRSVCVDYTSICRKQENGVCVEHKEICVLAETKCDLQSGK